FEGSVGNGQFAVLGLPPGPRRGFTAVMFGAYAADLAKFFGRIDKVPFGVGGVLLPGNKFYDVSPITAGKAVKDLHIEIDVQRRPRVAVKRTKRLPLGSASATQFDAVVLEHSFEACGTLDRLEVDAMSPRQFRSSLSLSLPGARGGGAIDRFLCNARAFI